VGLRPALDAEVVVAGGGPAGAATAALLARAGVDVLVLERARFPREKACAEYLSPGVAAVLERLGALPEILRTGIARPRWLLLETSLVELIV
jgi:2-polyprenyl-6-methoxyphenol hydroxylase-like FAD-dependent oxidoreductase